MIKNCYAKLMTTGSVSDTQRTGHPSSAVYYNPAMLIRFPNFEQNNQTKQ